MADTRLLGAGGTSLDDDARRAGLLAATRRMTVFLMVVLPLFLISLVGLWSFRSASWTPVLLVVVCLGALGSCALTAELWRRLGRLSDLTALNFYPWAWQHY